MPRRRTAFVDDERAAHRAGDPPRPGTPVWRCDAIAAPSSTPAWPVPSSAPSRPPSSPARHWGWRSETERRLGPVSRSTSRELTAGLGDVLLVGHDPSFTLTVHDLTGAQARMKKGGLAAIAKGELVICLLRPVGAVSAIAGRRGGTERDDRSGHRSARRPAGRLPQPRELVRSRSLFVNRELSWLAFNDRVLQLAEDEIAAAAWSG